MIYLDNAATTKTAPEVVEAMLPYFSEYYGNPSSIYAIAGKSKEAITKGREQIANVLGAKPEEIYFTAGGSESDNWALKATFEAYKNKGNHIITTKIEHHAILHTCEYLEKERGAKVTYVGVDENGVERPVYRTERMVQRQHRGMHAHLQFISDHLANRQQFDAKTQIMRNLHIVRLDLRNPLAVDILHLDAFAKCKRSENR